jgi:hypothetical protein
MINNVINSTDIRGRLLKVDGFSTRQWSGEPPHLPAVGQKELPMDKKELWLISKLHEKIVQGTFTETDVLSLLILLREHVGKTSPIREFGDFIAHRAKDRGIIKDLTSLMKRALSGEFDHEPRTIDLPAFTLEQVCDSFNKAFKPLGLSSIDLEVANKITVFIITLLQSVKIKLNENTPIFDFKVGISSSHIALLGEVEGISGNTYRFPLIMALNQYEPIKDMPVFMTLDRIVESVCEGGTVKLQQKSQMI